jgi:hypothetical protein
LKEGIKVSLATNELLAVTDKNIQVERVIHFLLIKFKATAKGDQYVTLQTQ